MTWSTLSLWFVNVLRSKNVEGYRRLKEDSGGEKKKVELFMGEMKSATSMDDARSRATSVL